MPAPPPFPGKAAFHGPCSPAGCQGAAASSRGGSRGRGPSSPSSPPSLPSPGRCGLLPSLLRKRVTPRARGQRPRGAAHGSHLQLGAHLPAWLRDQTGNKNSPAWPEPHALLPAATGEPRHPRPAAFGVASDPPLSSADITSCSKNAPGLGSKGAASVLHSCPGGGQPCHEIQTRAWTFLSS